MKPQQSLKLPPHGHVTEKAEQRTKLSAASVSSPPSEAVATSSTQNWQKYCDARMRQFANFR